MNGLDKILLYFVGYLLERIYERLMILAGGSDQETPMSKKDHAQTQNTKAEMKIPYVLTIRSL